MCSVHINKKGQNKFFMLSMRGKKSLNKIMKLGLNDKLLKNSFYSHLRGNSSLYEN